MFLFWIKPAWILQSGANSIISLPISTEVVWSLPLVSLLFQPSPTLLISHYLQVDSVRHHGNVSWWHWDASGWTQSHLTPRHGSVSNVLFCPLAIWPPGAKLLNQPLQCHCYQISISVYIFKERILKEALNASPSISESIFTLYAT